MINSLDEIAKLIRQNSRFALTSHARPDGDSIGSQLALALALEHLGKSVRIVNADPVPAFYQFLPGMERIEVSPQLDGEFDALIVLECNSLERTGVRGLSSYQAVNIDHHKDAGEYGLLNWVDPESAAVAEMIYRLIKLLDVPITPGIATNLYVGIMTDTGSFRFSNTTERTFLISSDLTRLGADPAAIAQQVYMNYREAKVRLLGRVLDTLQIHSSREIAWLVLTDEMLSESGAGREDTEGIINHALSISGVNLAAFFREEASGGVRVSLRSKTDYDVARVAQHFGGGGHAKAAGLSTEGPLSQAVGRIVSYLETLLSPER